MTAHVVAQACTLIRTPRGLIQGCTKEVVRGGCETIYKAYVEYGCMQWNVQGHEVRFCPYCGEEIIYLDETLIEGIETLE